MGWAEQLPSGRWRALIRVGKKQRNATPGVTYGTKAEAERIAGAKELKARSDPDAVDLRDGRMSLGRFAAECWWDVRRVEPGVATVDRGRWGKHIEPVWGATALNDILREDLQRWINSLTVEPAAGGSGLSAQSTHHCAHLVSSCLTAAVQQRRLTRSPYHDMKLPPLLEGVERFLTRDEVSSIARVMDEPYRTMMLLLVGAGLRWGEAAGLHWSRTNLAEGWIDVLEVWDQKTREIKPYPKGRKLRRVWLADWLLVELERHRREHPAARQCGATHRRGSLCRSGLVVPGPRGAAMGYANFHQRHWGTAVGRHRYRAVGDPKPDRTFTNPSEVARIRALRGLEVAQIWMEGLAEVGPVRIHDLRHTYASWALQGRPDADPPELPVPIYDLAIAMGHKDTEITRRYGHLAESSRDRFRRALAWEGPSKTAPRVPHEDDLPHGQVIDFSARLRRSQGL